MEQSQLMSALQEQEHKLYKQLVSTQAAILGFGGTPAYEIPGARPAETVSVTTLEPPVEEPKEETKFRFDTPTEPKKQKFPKDVYGYIIEILKEENKPMNAKQVHAKLAELEFEYRPQSIPPYLSVMEQQGLIIRVDRGLYAHKEWTSPAPLKKNVMTIKEVSKYFELHKEARRQDLVEFFVKGGLMTENMLQGRLEKLIKDQFIYRKEHGVYKLRKSH